MSRRSARTMTINGAKYREHVNLGFRDGLWRKMVVLVNKNGATVDATAREAVSKRKDQGWRLA